MPRSLGARLAVRLARHRAAAAAVVVILGFVTAVLVAGSGSVYNSARTAAAQGAITWRGQPSGYVVQGLNPSQQQSLAYSPGAMAVASVEAAFSANGRADSGTAWVVSHVGLGYLSRGRLPTDAHQIALSAPLADVLHAGLGDQVRVTVDGSVLEREVVGLVRNPASADEKAAILLGSSTFHPSPSYWVLADSPGQEASIAAATEAGSLRASSNLTAYADGLGDLPRRARLLRPLPALLGLLCLAVGVGLMQAFSVVARRDVDALAAAGLPRSFGWRVIGATALCLTMSGILVGVLAVAVTLRLGRQPLSHALGQDWLTASIAWRETLLVIIAPLVIMRLMRPLITLWRHLVQRSESGGTSPVPVRWRTSALLASATLLGAGLTWWATAHRAQALTAILAALLGEILVLACLRHLGVHAATGLGAGQSRRPLARRLIRGASAFHFSGVILVVVSVFYASFNTEGEPPADPWVDVQPRGSYLVESVPAAAATRILDSYARLGGTRGEALVVPASPYGDVRVTRPCSGVAPSPSAEADCGNQTVLNVVMLAPGTPADFVRAEVNAVVNGNVVVLALGHDGDRNHAGHPNTAVAAMPDPDLGGNMPGLVVSPTGSIAHDFKLEDSGLRQISLRGYGSLAPDDQARLRSQIASLAPASLTSDSSTLVDPADIDRATTSVVTRSAAALVVLLLLLGVAAQAVSTRDLRTTLRSVGARRRFRFEVWTRSVVPDVVTAVAIAIATPFFVSAATVGPAGHLDAAWLLPLWCYVILTVVPQAYLGLVPRRGRGD